MNRTIRRRSVAENWLREPAAVHPQQFREASENRGGKVKVKVKVKADAASSSPQYRPEYGRSMLHHVL